MSSRHVLPAAFVALSLALSGCLKPEDRFDEFAARVVDASPGGAACHLEPGGAPIALPDISGEHLLTIAVSFAPDDPLQVRCAMAMTPDGDGATMDMSCTPLTVDGRTDVGEPLGQTGITVNPDGGFCATIVGTVPGVANPISGSNIVTADSGLTLTAYIKDADLFCGEFEGAITMPFAAPIHGSFAGVRTTPGATGDALPAPVKACPP